ncbi:hypothetical protein RSWS8N_17544 [Cereibacter sphaeroides WS8N]|nr:hypothetical protein RSWS8N_17544 [Cereibacter sphaeroides WS8N]
MKLAGQRLNDRVRPVQDHRPRAAQILVPDAALHDTTRSVAGRAGAGWVR